MTSNGVAVGILIIGGLVYGVGWLMMVIKQKKNKSSRN